MFSLKTYAVNKVLEKIEKDIKKETGYDLNVVFNDPIKLKINHGKVMLHTNFDVEADLGLITEFINKDEGE